MSPASKRERFMFGILAWGSSRNVTSPDSLKFGRFAISSKGGASALASRWVLVTTWHAEHHRSASRSPLKASAAKTGCTAPATASTMHQRISFSPCFPHIFHLLWDEVAKSDGSAYQCT